MFSHKRFETNQVGLPTFTLEKGGILWIPLQPLQPPTLPAALL